MTLGKRYTHFFIDNGLIYREWEALNSFYFHVGPCKRLLSSSELDALVLLNCICTYWEEPPPPCTQSTLFADPPSLLCVRTLDGP